MSVNLNKNKQQILDAWKKVTENEDGYDWALFGYEGKSFDLKVVRNINLLLKKKIVKSFLRTQLALAASKLSLKRSTRERYNTPS